MKQKIRPIILIMSAVINKTAISQFINVSQIKATYIAYFEKFVVIEFTQI